jgi:2-amino-4-hydroxy-6-hydroxymethyldihydropteridine diphosphokinase
MADVAYIALGSNVGDRQRHLAVARDAIARLPGTKVLAATPIEETEPFGSPNQDLYLNQMIAIETELEPHDLLHALQQVERGEGRVRAERWGPRTLDLDIVKFGEHRIEDASLVIPHPGLRDRAFWQRELTLLETNSQ